MQQLPAHLVCDSQLLSRDVLIEWKDNVPYNIPGILSITSHCLSLTLSTVKFCVKNSEGALQQIYKKNASGGYKKFDIKQIPTLDQFDPYIWCARANVSDVWIFWKVPNVITFLQKYKTVFGPSICQDVNRLLCGVCLIVDVTTNQNYCADCMASYRTCFKTYECIFRIPLSEDILDIVKKMYLICEGPLRDMSNDSSSV